MRVYYLDTSALVKLYVQERGSEEMVRLADPASSHTLVVLALTRVEFRSAVRQRERVGDISPELAKALIGRMEVHLQNLYMVQLTTEAVLEEAAALVDRHPLRAYDAVQLAGCLAFRSSAQEAPAFVCSDRQLLSAAEEEGLRVFNPEG